MKPSEVLSKLFLESDMGKGLDKRFIDREELKKQIDKLFFDLRQKIPKKMKPNKKEILAIESLFYIQGEILELLK